MEIGMLWYDGDAKRTLDQKVASAVEYYTAKYGAAPTVCFMNASLVKESPEVRAGVQLRPARTIMPDHFWLGVDEAANAEPRYERGTRQKKAKGGSA